MDGPTEAWVPADSALGERVLNKAAWRLVPLLIALTMINQLDRSNIGYAALTMNDDLGLSPGMFGFAAGVFMFGYVMFEIPSNVFMARVGANRWIARIMLVWGVVAMGMAFVTGPDSLYVMRFLLGAAEAGFIPGVTLYVLMWFPLRRRAGITAIWFMSVPLTGIVGGPLSGLLLQLNGWQGLAGWQWMFVLEGLPAIALATAAWFWLTPSPAEATWLSRDERRWLEQTLAEERSGIEREMSRLGLLAALGNWRVLVLGLLYIGMNMGLVGVNIWMPTIVKSLATLSVMEVTLIIAAIWAAAGVSAFCWGRWSDRAGERYGMLAVALFAGAAGFASSAYLGSPVLGCAALAVATMGILSAYTIFWVLPGTFLTGVAAAAGIALINCMGNLGGFAGPFAVGWLREVTGSFQVALVMLSLGMAISGVIAWALRPRSGKRAVVATARGGA